MAEAALAEDSAEAAQEEASAAALAEAEALAADTDPHTEDLTITDLISTFIIMDGFGTDLTITTVAASLAALLP